MEIENYTGVPQFTGTIKQTELFKNYALEYARGIKVGDEDWSKLKMFINTIRAVKNDQTSDEFVIDKIGSANRQLWYIKYGDYLNQNEYYRSDIYNQKTYGKDALAREVFKKVIQFGKEHFGLGILSKPIEEFSPANVFLKRANNYANKSRIAKDRDSSIRLAQKAQTEEARAEETISQIKSRLLSNI